MIRKLPKGSKRTWRQKGDLHQQFVALSLIFVKQLSAHCPELDFPNNVENQDARKTIPYPSPPYS